MFFSQALINIWIIDVVGLLYFRVRLNFATKKNFIQV